MKISFFTPFPYTHAPEEKWQRYLIHPLRIFYGDGSRQWSEYAPAFDFYTKLFTCSETIEEADAVFLPFTYNYYDVHQCLEYVTEMNALAEKHRKKLFF